MAATAALTSRPHAARVSPAPAAYIASGEFIIANARRRTVDACLANGGPT